MTTSRYHWPDLGVTAEVSTFSPIHSAVSPDGERTSAVVEWHAMLHVEPRGEMFAGQYGRLVEGQKQLIRLLGAQLTGGDSSADALPTVITRRYFLSDSTNQRPCMADAETPGTTCIQQPPLDGSKVALWLYMQHGSEVTDEDGMRVVRHGGYTHLWSADLTAPNEPTSHDQTHRVLTDYSTQLSRHGASLADHCIRTWFCVRDVDTQYAGLVRARRDFFEAHGLTPATHYLASTGIQGLPAATRALIDLSAYAVTGLAPEQQRYLYALDHLNRTIDYGVTFERGTLVTYGDRDHAYISGTASIDDRGNVVAPGDIVRQTHRMWENVAALLAEGGMSLADAAFFIVYLRDTADYVTVRDLFATRFPDTPTVITLAPVCRPAWLIEMETIAIAERQHPEFRAM